MSQKKIRRDVFFLVPAMLALSACNDESAKPQPRNIEVTNERQSAGQAWLGPFDHEQPAAWLISHQKYAEHDADDRDVAKVSALLNSAGQTFQESSRMIVNRVLQIQEMLDEVGDHESAVALVRDLSSVVGPGVPNPGFGNLAAYYLNLRRNRENRATALHDLTKKYQGTFP